MIFDGKFFLKEVSSASNVQRQIIKFGGAPSAGGGGSGSRRSSRAFSGRHSFTEAEQEDIEATGTEINRNYFVYFQFGPLSLS